MAAHIVLHFACGRLLHIQLGVNDFFPIPYRIGDHMAIGIHHTAAAATGDIRQPADLFFPALGLGVVCLCKVHIAVDEEAVAFDGDMTDAILPFRVVIGVGRNIDGDPFLVKGHPGQRHVAFPADQIAHGPPKGCPSPGKSPCYRLPRPLARCRWA